MDNEKKQVTYNSSFSGETQVTLDIQQYMNNKAMYIGLMCNEDGYDEPFGDVTVNLSVAAPNYCGYLNVNDMPDIEKFISKISYNYSGELETLCAGIAYGADDVLCGNSKMIIRFDDNDVSVNDWYDLTTTNAEQIRFYKNGRIDVKFKDSAAAESCFKRLRLDEITLPEN